ncbi:IpaC/SipC family type III secretion system effector [Iodobacter fluviatilis]|uniref:Effector protein BipC n=1 Tax=Iodobacter fluviatilis TaxID=537 RepID=A0A377Q690_9NEIS|nr:IpaC/SipC family type III secretion system effector [Iodobacter fluviatilis]TCU86899.1 IpaC/SipC-like invasin protein C [Iodobacter fluviatilis]STQ90230.1 Effector protein SipC [Iodobacter fluviatilis]
MVAINSSIISTLPQSKAFAQDFSAEVKGTGKSKGAASTADVQLVLRGQSSAKGLLTPVNSVGVPDLKPPMVSLSEAPPLDEINRVLTEKLNNADGVASLGGSIVVLEKQVQAWQKEAKASPSFDISGLGSRSSELMQKLLEVVQDNRTAEAKLGGKMSAIEEKQAHNVSDSIIKGGSDAMSYAIGGSVVSIATTVGGASRKSQGTSMAKDTLKHNGGKVRAAEGELRSMSSSLKTGSGTVMGGADALTSVKVKPQAKSLTEAQVVGHKNDATDHVELANSSPQLTAQQQAALKEQTVNKLTTERDLNQDAMQKNLAKADAIKNQGDMVMGLSMIFSNVIRGVGDFSQAHARSTEHLSQQGQKVAGSLNEESGTRKRELNTLFQDLLRQVTDMAAQTMSTMNQMLNNKV